MNKPYYTAARPTPEMEDELREAMAALVRQERGAPAPPSSHRPAPRPKPEPRANTVLRLKEIARLHRIGLGTAEIAARVGVSVAIIHRELRALAAPHKHGGSRTRRPNA